MRLLLRMIILHLVEVGTETIRSEVDVVVSFVNRIQDSVSQCKGVYVTDHGSIISH